MNKIMNLPEDYERNVLDGFLSFHRKEIMSLREDRWNLVRKSHEAERRTAVIAVADGGHLPFPACYIGAGMLDGAVIGDVFRAPRSEDILQVIRAIDRGLGIVIIQMHWQKELSFETALAATAAEKEGIHVCTAVINDDCMPYPRDDIAGRPSLSGLVFAAKIAAAAAMDGYSVDRIAGLLERVKQNLRSAAVAAGSFCLPGSNAPFMRIDPNMMQIGIGLHGEDGFEMIDFPPADTIAEHLFRHRFLKELDLKEGDRVALMVNNLGCAAPDELYMIFREEMNQFEKRGIIVIHPLLGNYISTLDLDGISLSVLQMDEEMQRLYLQPCSTPGLTMR